MYFCYIQKNRYMEIQVFLSRINQLPEAVRLQLFDYATYLFQKYIPTQDDSVLSEEGKQFLDKRIQEHQKNFEKAKTAEEIEQAIIKKYGYEL